MATIKTDKPVYYLLGEQACNRYMDDPDNFEQYIKDEGFDFDFDLAKIEDGTPLNTVLDIIDGYFGWGQISENDYNLLNTILNKINGSDQ